MTEKAKSQLTECCCTKNLKYLVEIRHFERKREKVRGKRLFFEKGGCEERQTQVGWSFFFENAAHA